MSDKSPAFYKAFYREMMAHWGTGLNVKGWHLNGALEPLDNFLDDAQNTAAEEAEKAKTVNETL